jgi:hypothetical protein
MTKLTDIQAILLSTAAQRENGSLLPIPEPLADKEADALIAIQQLIKRKLAKEAETADQAETFRADCKMSFAAMITEAGKQAIGAVDPDAGQPLPASAPDPKPVRTDSKQAKVLELLQCEQGASIAELQQATGWLPHTTRAALTGIRKRGTELVKSKVDGVTRYKAVAAQ